MDVYFHEWYGYSNIQTFDLNATFYFHRQLEAEMLVVFRHSVPFSSSRSTPRPTRWHRPWLANAGRAEAAGEWQVPSIFFCLSSYSSSVRPRLDPSHRLLRDGIRDEHSPQLFPSGADYWKPMIFRKWRVKYGRCNDVGSTSLMELIVRRKSGSADMDVRTDSKEHRTRGG